MGASVLRKKLFKKMTCGLRPAGKEPALCGVWGQPGEELPRPREQQVQKPGLSKAQAQGAWVWVMGKEWWRSCSACDWG